MRTFTLAAISVAAIIGAAAQESQYTPLVREGVEWGYVEELNAPYGHVTYNRLQFYGSAEIDGKEYKPLYMYTTHKLSIPFLGTTTPAAWMREEDRRVYAVYNPDYAAVAHAHSDMLSLEFAGEEILLYDFNVSAGDTYYIGPENQDIGYRIGMQCLSVEEIQCGEGARKLYTFMQEDFRSEVKILEGAGPYDQVSYGNQIGSFLYPFHVMTTSIPSTEVQDILLYERRLESEETEGWEWIGPIVAKYPSFDYYGPHDPTVWAWYKSMETDSAPALSAATEGMKISQSQGLVTIEGTDSEIASVELFEPTGYLLKTLKPHSSRAQLSVDSHAGELLILRVKLADGTSLSRKIVAR